VPKPPQVLGRKVAPDEGEPERKSREPSTASASQETVPHKTRRQFTASEKLRLVNAAEAALASGERGALEALLRKEAIYSSQLSAWRQQLGTSGEAGLTSRKPGRKPKHGARDRELLAITKQNEILQRKLRVADALIALQKKMHEVLGLALPELPEEN
jgi:transposase-like protein